jgi:hypothetical protein
MASASWGGLLAGLLVLALGRPVLAGLPADLAIVVVDESGQKVEGATVNMTFVVSDEQGGVVGATDTNGEFRAGTTASDGGAYFRVIKSGYYPTAGEYDFRKMEGNRWVSPDAPVEVQLRPVVNPVPMYARNAQMDIPKEGVRVGYDLEIGDWTAPYGDGRTGDLLFSFTRRFVEWNNFDVMLELTFSNPDDGIQEVRWPFKSWLGSMFRLPRMAPLTGYATNLVLGFGSDPKQGYYNMDRPKDMNYLFRVRSQTNKYGQITNAWYGKIYGDFAVDGYGTDRTALKFLYYVNPDGTPNMEFDPERNRSRNIGRWEGVSSP